jgi:methyltransferase
MVSRWLYLGFLGLLGIERIVELLISRRNAAWAFAQGGQEYGARHFRYMTLLHALFLCGCAAEVLLLARPFHPWLGYPMLGLALATQALRYWVIATLGHQWNVRVIVVPGAPRVTSGPYRFLRHPNYLGVIAEGFAIPLVHTAWITALVFSLLNAGVLAVRIPCEERALGGRCGTS